ncbi:copper chaperone PCu(A)C [Sphingomonas sp. Leaf22]|uniref:copper chaperone PCu(A)C n=1 Tax=Sphingomonas sp. Leaf22 TaxID=1735687 RepID=UPI000A454415|nr:copper chaperone PCu(A)C [Sphingomonas sp. Leaf22]
MKTQWAGTLVAALMLSGCQKGPSVDDAWVRLPAVPGRPAAGYATVRGGSGNDVLTSVASPAVQRAELHESMASHGGMMAMRALDKVKVEGSIGFSPGGKHIMLFGLSPDLRAGGTIPMTFGFEDGSKVTVDVKLVAAGDPEP